MSARILVVEDDAALLTILEAAVSYGGFTSDSVRSGADAIETFTSEAFDVVLMDLGLPDMDGRELLKTLRRISDLPIIVVSGRGSERDKIEALDLGADDFVPKPFLPGELLARIRAALRRYETSKGRAPSAPPPPPENDDRNPIQLGALVLDPYYRTASLHGREVTLNDAEFRVLRVLSRTPDVPVPRTTILEELYGDNAPSETKIVEVYISHIRKKLRQLDDTDELITTSRGQGWTLNSPA